MEHNFFKKITASLICGSPAPLFPINPRANKFPFPTPMEKLGSKINLEISLKHKNNSTQNGWNDISTIQYN
jgi:hypothetical protein